MALTMARPTRIRRASTTPKEERADSEGTDLRSSEEVSLEEEVSLGVLAEEGSVKEAGAAPNSAISFAAVRRRRSLSIVMVPRAARRRVESVTISLCLDVRCFFAGGSVSSTNTGRSKEPDSASWFANNR